MGGHIHITKAWSISLLKRMCYVKRKATCKAIPGLSAEKFALAKKKILKQVGRMVKLRNIPDCLIIDLDQTGIKLVPCGD